MNRLFNTVLPGKIYGIWGMSGRSSARLLDEIPATNVDEAFTAGRKKFGDACRAAFLLPGKRKADEPMFAE